MSKFEIPETLNVRVATLKDNLPFLIATIVLVVIAVLLLSQPKAGKRRSNTGPIISVEAYEIKRLNITPKVLSYGLVTPRTETKLVAQVSGRVERISERFRDGGFFKQGEVLLQIDTADYEIAVDIAESSLASAEQTLAEELAQVEQAHADLVRLGTIATASSLALRQPQLKTAQANLNSAKARLKMAQINLARTYIRAPYDGRVLSTSIDLGQVASNNTILGEVYATDAIEVRLPIKNNDLPLLKLPEDYQHQDRAPVHFPAVKIRSELAKNEVWQGKIIRTASSIDPSSRQLYVVARIDDPFGEKAKGRFPLKIGQYVTAEIEGINLHSAISIPNKSIYQGSYVYLYKEGAVYRTDIKISWQNEEIAIISEGIKSGDQLVVSPLGQVTTGTLVKLTRAAPTMPENGSLEKTYESTETVAPQDIDAEKKKGATL